MKRRKQLIQRLVCAEQVHASRSLTPPSVLVGEDYDPSFQGRERSSERRVCLPSQDSLVASQDLKLKMFSKPTLLPPYYPAL